MQCCNSHLSTTAAITIVTERKYTPISDGHKEEFSYAHIMIRLHRCELVGLCNDYFVYNLSALVSSAVVTCKIKHFCKCFANALFYMKPRIN